MGNRLATDCGTFAFLIALTTAAPANESVAPATAPVAAVRPLVNLRERLVVMVGGDVSFGREAGRSVIENADYRPFRALDALWADADLRIANLESQLTDQNGETQSPYDRLVFAGPPESANVLFRAGVHAVSTANNHAWDYGKGALLETLLYLDRAGVAHAGTGATLAEAESPLSLTVKGWRIALLAVTQIWNQGEFKRHPGRKHVAWADAASVAERIARARRDHDLVFVSFHGGAEYVNAPNAPALSFVDRSLRAGSDAVFGHHPHVVQGIGWFKGRPAFYSLGNLMFGSRRGYPWTRYGMLARLEFGPDGQRAFSICPFRIEIGSHEPSVLDGKYGDYDRARFHRHLREVQSAVGPNDFGVPDANGCVSIAPAVPVP